MRCTERPRALHPAAVLLLGGAAVFMMTKVPVAQQPAQLGGAAQGQVTFTKDVAPILQRSCQNCHRPGAVAPMSLLTYEDARPWARSIKQRASNREMPPWHIDRNIGVRKFKDDPSLSDGEIATLVKWADSGAPKGDPANMPPPREFSDLDKWHIGKPDLIVSLPEEHTVPAAGPDWWGNYWADSGLTEDRYVKAIETKPSTTGFKVVHHVVAYAIQDDDREVERGELDDLGRPLGTQINEYALGKNGDIFPEGTGLLLKKGAQIRFNLHYHPNGEAVKDRSSVGVVFYPKGYVPKYRISSAGPGLQPNDDLDIPAGVVARHEGYMRLSKPARIVTYQPHMHNRGKAMCMEAVYENGTTEMLSCVNQFHFGWHIAYNYADDVAPLLPAGTMLHVVSWHDNTSANKYNPDPRNWAGYGQRTIDDMAFAHVKLVYLTEEDFKQQVEERKTKQTKSESLPNFN